MTPSLKAFIAKKHGEFDEKFSIPLSMEDFEFVTPAIKSFLDSSFLELLTELEAMVPKEVDHAEWCNVEEMDKNAPCDCNASYHNACVQEILNRIKSFKENK